MKCLILGASGLVGKALTLELLNHDYQSITLLKRGSSPLFDRPRINEVKVDYDDLVRYADEFDVDHVYCCLGTTIKKAKTKENFEKVDYQYPLEAAKLFQKSAQKSTQSRCYTVITAIGASTDSPFFYSQTKGRLEQSLKKLNLPRLVIIRPSVLLGAREEYRPLESFSQMALKLMNPLFVSKLKKYRGHRDYEVAKTMIELTLNRPLTTEDIEFEVFP